MRWTAAAAWLCIILPGCQHDGEEAHAGVPGGSRAPSSSAVVQAPPVAGATCRSGHDCGDAQVCVSSVCRYRSTNNAGEILAAGARGQLEAGDTRGAVASYDQALAAYASSHAPAPPEVLCGAATAALRAAVDGDAREKAARLSDACFRGSLPGDERRRAVQERMARLRFDGLDLSSFDGASPPARFFTAQPSRPTADAIEMALDLPEGDEPGYAQLTEALRDEGAQRGISECFVQNWERRHERSAEASLVLRFASHLRDMGDYDVYVPELEVAQVSTEQDGFDHCVATALTTALQPGPRLGRSVTRWQETFSVAARVQ